MRSYLNAIRWEMILTLKEYVRYRVGLLMDFCIFAGIFIAIYFFEITAGFQSYYSIDENSGKMLILIGYIFWQNATTALGYSTGTISNETMQGVFEMRLQGKYAIEGILFFRLLSHVLIHLITYIGIIAIGAFFIGYNVRDIGMLIVTIAVSMPSLLGMYGIGLLFGSICVREKSVGSLVLIVQTILLYITNTLSPARGNYIYAIPFTGGIDIMRNLYLKTQIPAGLITGYIAINLFWLLIGLFVFRKALKHEQKYGTFDNY